MRHLANLKSLTVALLVSSGALSAGGEQPVTVTVQHDAGDCLVLSRTARCRDVGRYLRNELSIASNRLIVVMVKGAGEAAERRGREVVSILRASGFQNIEVAGSPAESSARAP